METSDYAAEYFDVEKGHGGYVWAHIEYDGPDGRWPCGIGKTEQDCWDDIIEWIENDAAE